MSREVPFDKDAICDVCGKQGAFDFMGDLLCSECTEKYTTTDADVFNERL